MSFSDDLSSRFDEFRTVISTDNNQWVIKGFIDLYQRIYPMTVDTKVISKIIELTIFPTILSFSQQHDYEMQLSAHQNHYPDISLIDKNSGEMIALDLKSTYRTSPTTINGMTLGAFTGYFRQRTITKNITYPYIKYSDHYVLGIVYTRSKNPEDERKIFTLEDLPKIASVAENFEFILQEKWKIASDKPGSGNTKNIGSVKSISRLMKGAGPFSFLGKDVFDDYWMHYLTKDMAKQIDSHVPYKNLKEYISWRKDIIREKAVNLDEVVRILEEEETLERKSIPQEADHNDESI